MITLPKYHLLCEVDYESNKWNKYIIVYWVRHQRKWGATVDRWGWLVASHCGLSLSLSLLDVSFGSFGPIVTWQRSSVYSRIWKLPVIFSLQLPMYVRCAAMRGAPQCAACTSLIGTTLAELSKQLRNITYRQLFNKHTILSCLFLKMVVYCNKQPLQIK